MKRPHWTLFAKEPRPDTAIKVIYSPNVDGGGEISPKTWRVAHTLIWIRFLFTSPFDVTYFRSLAATTDRPVVGDLSIINDIVTIAFFYNWSAVCGIFIVSASSLEIRVDLESYGDAWWRAMQSEHRKLIRKLFMADFFFMRCMEYFIDSQRSPPRSLPKSTDEALSRQAHQLLDASTLSVDIYSEFL